MTITQNGNSFTWTGTVTVTNGTDLSTGVAVLVLTPQGGVGNLPVLADGPPGLPPVLRNVTVNQIPYGQTIPAPSWTQVSPGGPGVASVYDLTMSVQAGQQGPTGTMTIGSATDLTGTATVGYTPIVSSLNGTTPTFKYAGQLCGDSVNATTFTAASGNAPNQVLATVNIAAQPFDWRPNVSGQAIPSGTANTHVDLICRLNNQTSGDQVGYGSGITGAGSGTIPAYPVSLNRGFGGAIGTGSYGRVSKGNSATLYFMTNQTAATVDAYTCPTAGAYFTVKVDPIPGTN